MKSLLAKLAVRFKDACRSLLYAVLPGRLVHGLVQYRLPRVVNLELTTACNLECPLCPTHVVPRDTRFLDSTQVEQLLRGNDGLKKVCLHVQGEPLIHGQLFDIVRELSERDIETHVGTNGMLIESKLEELLTSGLTSISIAIDGASSEDYQRYRVRGDFEQVTRGTHRLLSERKKRASDLPRVQVQAVMFSYNEDREIDLLSFLEAFKADSVALKRPSYFNDFDQWNDTESDVDLDKLDALQRKSDEFLKQIDTDREWSRSEDSEEQSPFRTRKMCPQLEKGTVLCDGRVVACCMDGDGTTEFGNLKEESFAEIWRGERHAERLREFRAGTLSACKNCTLGD